jgi:hypothetical protein
MKQNMLTYYSLLTLEGKAPFRSCRGEVPIAVRHLSLTCAGGNKKESNDIFFDNSVVA